MPLFSEEMRQAADILQRWTERTGAYPHADHVAWSPAELRQESRHVEAEEREAREREELTARLAMDIFNTPGMIAVLDYDTLRPLAEGLIEAGWHQ